VVPTQNDSAILNQCREEVFMRDEIWIKGFISQGESIEREFKSERARQFGDSEVYEQVVALANSGGGLLLLGVEDDGAITGARGRHGARTDGDRLSAAIRNNTHPSISTTCSEITTSEGTVVAIEVPILQGVFATRAGKYLRRQVGSDGKPESVPYFPFDGVNTPATGSAADYTAHVLTGASLDDLDPIQFERLRQTIARLHGDQVIADLDDIEMAKALRLVESCQEGLSPTVASLLLLGKREAIERFLPTHAVHFQVFDAHGGVRVNETFKGPVLEIAEDIEERFRARNQEREIGVGLVRLPVPDYAPESLREAFNNALLHRDYTRQGGIYVQWHPDHLLITSPGPFPTGVNVDNLLVHEPLPRNPRLAEAFKRIGLVEQTGRGVDLIYSGQLRYGRPAPDYSRTDAEGVRVVLPGGQPSLEFAAFVYEEDKAGRPLTLNELLILNTLFLERRVDAPRAGALIQEGTAQGRAMLERMIERGLVEARGSRRTRVYMLSAALYRRLHQEAEYVRARGFDSVQQEQMVLSYVRAHGSIARGDTARLCQIEPRQANRLLTRMVQKYPEFTMIGTKRGARYMLVDTPSEQAD